MCIYTWKKAVMTVGYGGDASPGQQAEGRNICKSGRVTSKSALGFPKAPSLKGLILPQSEQE